MMSERGITVGTILYDTYVIQDVLGEGGFGITYRGIQQSTGESVAIKEYFPFALATRQHNSDQITVSQQDLSEYAHGKERFIKEASILKEYQYLQGIVKVWDWFETNNTAYIIMEYIEGVTLKEYISFHGRMQYDELIEVMSPVLKSLVTLHKHGVIHRDISPDNLMIGLNNDLYLIDFGAAREVERGKTTTVLLKAGYAPPEQYLHDGDLGAWTDVYALCATIYTALCGKVPTDAVARLQGKELLPLSSYDVRLENWQWEAIAKGMSMRGAMRFRNVEQLYDALTIEPSDEDIKTVVGQELEPFHQQQMRRFSEKEQAGKRTGKRFWGVAVLVGLAVVFAVVFNDRGLLGSREDVSGASGEQQEKHALEQVEIKLCSMPNVVGLNKEEALKEIEAIDQVIEVHISRTYSDDVPANVVIEQSVKADTQYNEGTIKEMNITVSDGVEPTTQATTEAVTQAPVKEEKKQEAKSDNNFKVESKEDEEVEFYLD